MILTYGLFCALAGAMIHALLGPVIARRFAIWKAVRTLRNARENAVGDVPYLGGFSPFHTYGE